MREEVKSVRLTGRCAVGSAASAGVGVGSSTLARPLPLGQNTGCQRKLASGLGSRDCQ